MDVRRLNQGDLWGHSISIGRRVLTSSLIGSSGAGSVTRQGLSDVSFSARRGFGPGRGRDRPRDESSRPSDAEIETLRNDPAKLATIRCRLSDLGWPMITAKSPRSTEHSMEKN